MFYLKLLTSKYHEQSGFAIYLYTTTYMQSFQYILISQIIRGIEVQATKYSNFILKGNLQDENVRKKICNIRG